MAQAFTPYELSQLYGPGFEEALAEQEAMYQFGRAHNGMPGSPQIAQPPPVPQGGGPLQTLAVREGLDALIGGSSGMAGAADVGGGVLLAPGGEVVATAAPWATEGALLNPVTGEAVASMAPTAAATTASPWALGGFGTAGNVYAPGIGAVLAADVLMNKRHGGRGAAQGALAGAGIGSYFGPWGALAGAGIGAGVGYFGNFGDENRFLTEYNRAKALRDKGINWDLNTNEPSKGRSIDELIAEAQATGGNVEFARTRDESKLKPEDIWGYSQWGEKFGNDYLKKFTEDQRRKINQAALDKGAVREHSGTVDINFTPELDKLIDEIIKPKVEAKK